MNKPVARILVLTAAVGLVGVSVAPAASAKSPRVVETQMCGSIETKLKLSGEDGGIEVEYELDQNVNGRQWALKMTRNGAAAGSAMRTTRAPSGSLHWRVVAADGAGADAFTVTAKRGSTTCTISASI